MSSEFPLITVLGPTAVGKTAFASHLAIDLNAEIISADSRQIFRGMDIGTGKDLEDYRIKDQVIPSHLIDIVDPGTEYNVFQFQRDFGTAYDSIVSRGKIPLMCGGTGLYLESVLLGYNLEEAPVNRSLRQELDKLSTDELVSRLSILRHLHNTTDILDRGRLTRAIEIEIHKKSYKNQQPKNDFIDHPVIGIRFERKIIRERITARLNHRLNEGLIDEVRQLLKNGVSVDQMKLYGLEYKYVTSYISGELTYSQMFSLLNTAIHQFAKRQMTWFRRMESKGIRIFWLEGENGLIDNLTKAKKYVNLHKV